jgi:hypothetical protein
MLYQAFIDGFKQSKVTKIEEEVEVNLALSKIPEIHPKNMACSPTYLPLLQK